jgi:50S ribosomal subunit-associated GTPase HflX
VSATTGEGLPALKAAIEAALTADEAEMTLRVLPADYAIVPLLYREAMVLSEGHDGEATIVRCRVPERLLSRVERFRLDQ